ERFVASQMAPAVLDTLTVDVAAGEYLFRATGSSVRFPGFMTLYTEGVDEEQPSKETQSRSDDDSDGLEQQLSGDFEPGQSVRAVKLEPKQHFTQPPARYTEAMLEIGRASCRERGVIAEADASFKEQRSRRV